ncbi:MAG: hypothetical protein EOO14_06045 [Chitinophagaceae bacterium]|nr:MAG: hypothetical protein EOO14_06045 [Chitinophagaceae bacterium]
MADKILDGTSSQTNQAAVKGEFTGTGPTYVHDGGKGIQGRSQNGYGVHGTSVVGRGVVAESDTNYGLRATSRTLSAARCSSSEGSGVEGEAGSGGDGVRGTSISGNGVHGISDVGRGVYGQSNMQAGVVGESNQFDGVFGISHHPNHAGVSGHNPGGMAGFFNGDVVVTGDIRLLNADLAEDFDVTDKTEPGEVMVLTEGGTLTQCSKAYDKKVVGVLSGAGSYKPGIILDKQANSAARKPVAMMGKVYCKVDADTAPIEMGDMLTSSATPGYAMKAIDPSMAFGAVIGKALSSLNKGKGLIPILVVLQ